MRAGRDRVVSRARAGAAPGQDEAGRLSWGKEGFDFLGCHLRKRMSGPIWERDGKRVYFLQRWPSQRSMKRVRQRVKELTPRAAVTRTCAHVIAHAEPGAARMGQLLPHRERRRRVQPARRVRLATAAALSA